MEAFKTLIWLVNIFSAIAVIFLVLMQHGKGADAGAAFGTGSAQGVFGASGSANFLSRSTAIAAVVFFCTCLALAYVHANKNTGGLEFNTAPAPTAPVTPPATPAQQGGGQPVIPE